MSILVTGALGALGRPLCAWLEATASEAVERVDLPRQGEGRYRPCDVSRGADVGALLRDIRPSRIFHLAGTMGASFDTDLAVNALAAKNIFDALLEEQLAARVVLIGSAAEYGLVSAGENPIREDRVLRPVSSYGATKAVQTQIASHYANAHGMDIVVARLFNLIAPNLSERLFVGRVQRQIERYHRGEIGEIVLGNLEARRDYIEVETAVRQLQVIADKGCPGQVYHVASGRPVTMRALLQNLLGAAGIDPAVVRENSDAGGRRGYDVPVIYADMTKTRGLAGSERTA